jgi:hypothetical protein
VNRELSTLGVGDGDRGAFRGGVLGPAAPAVT